MTTTASQNKNTGKCDNCGRMATVSMSKRGAQRVEEMECPDCGADEFSLLLLIE